MVRRYNLQQEQRLCERNIRKYKRLENGCIDADNVAKYAKKQKEWTAKYNQLIIDNPDVLRAEPARLKLYGINATDLKPAIKAVEKAGTKPITNSSMTNNFSELKEHFKNRGYTMNDAIEQLDFACVRSSAYGVEKVLDEFPQAQKTFAGFGVSNSGVMCASFTGKISYNPKYYDTPEHLKSMIMGDKTGFHPKNTGIIETGSHEMGHILELALINKNNGGVFAWNKCTEAQRVVGEACKIAKKATKKNYSVLKGEVSRYSLKTPSECMAEAVADYIANGENASLLSKEIWKILKKELG